MDANFFMIARTDAGTDRDDLRVLDSLDVAVDSLQRQGKAEKALEYMQMALRFRRRLYGDRGQETVEYCRGMLKTAMASAGKRLEAADGSGAIAVLEAVQHSISGLPLDPFASEICGLYNTLALAHRRKGDLQASKRHIAKALQIAEASPSAQMDRAAAHLNLCVLQSTLRQHKEALASGLTAVQFAQEDLVNASLSDQPTKTEKVSVLAVAYHNVGVEQEHLSRLKEAVEWYSRANRLLDSHGKNVELQAQVQRTLKAAQQALEARNNSPETLLWKRKSVRGSETTPRLVSSAHTRNEQKSKASKQSGRSLMSPRRVENMMKSRVSENVPMTARKGEDTPPSVYQQFAMVNAIQSPAMSIQPLPSVHDISETDQDIRDLEAMGLLEYSLDTGRASPRTNRPAFIRVRGRKRLTRYQSEASTRKARSPDDKVIPGNVDSWDAVDIGKPNPLPVEELDSPKSQKQETNSSLPTPKPVPRKDFSRTAEEQLSLKSHSESQLPKTLPQTSAPPAVEAQPIKPTPPSKPATLPAKPTPPPAEPTPLPTKPVPETEPTIPVIPSAPQPPATDGSPDTDMEKAALMIQNVYRNKMKRRAKSDVPLPDPKVLQSAAIKIQTRFRALLAGRKAKLLRAKAQKKGAVLLHRCCKRLKDGSFVTLSVLRDESSLVASASDAKSTRELPIPQGVTLSPSEIAAKVDSDADGHLCLPAETDHELTKAALSIQALFRGKKTRERLRVEHERRASEMGIEFIPEKKRPAGSFSRPSSTTKPRDLLTRLLSPQAWSAPDPPAPTELQLSVPFNVEGKSQEELNSAIEQDIIPRLNIEDGKMVLEPTQEVTLLPGDEKKVTMMQSIFRMKMEKRRFDRRKADSGSGEVLARGEKELHGGNYLITIQRKPSSGQVEVDAYPLTKGHKKPQEFGRPESEVRQMLGWSANKPWVGNELEALAAVILTDSKITFTEVLFQIEDELGTPDMFLLQAIREPPLVRIVARPKNEQRTEPDPLVVEEATLRDMLGVDEEWAPVYWRDLIYRLQVTHDNRLSLPTQTSLPPPAIIVVTTPTSNIIGTENYHRIEHEAVVANPMQIEPAAVRIQAYYRGFHTRRHTAELRQKSKEKRVVYRTFNVSKRMGFAVSVLHSPPMFEVEVVALDSLSVKKSAISDSESLEDLKATLDRLISGEKSATSSRPTTPAKSVTPVSKPATPVSKPVTPVSKPATPVSKPATPVAKPVTQASVPMAKKESAVILIQKHIRGLIARNHYAKLKFDAQRKLKFTRRKMINAEEYFISIYAIKEVYQVECYKVNRTLQLQYHSKFIVIAWKKLQELYLQMPSCEIIYEDVTIAEGELKLLPRIRYTKVTPDRHSLPSPNTSALPGEPRTILRASKKLDTKMWVITMSITDTKAGQTDPHPDDKLEFSAFCGGVESALKVSETLGRLGNATGQPVDSVHPIGFLVINHMLKVASGSLILDFKVKMPNISTLITRVQAMIRGFLVRKKVKYEIKPFGLMTCQSRRIDGAVFTLYAYYDPKGIVLEAACKSPKQSYFCRLEGDPVLTIPENINKKKIFEDFVLPRLELVSQNSGMQLRIAKGEVPTMGLEIYVFKPKVGEKKADFKSVGRVQVIVKSILEVMPRQLADWTPSLASPPISPTAESDRSLHSKLSLRLPSSEDKETAEAIKRPVFEIAEEAEDSESVEKKPVGALGRLFSPSISPVVRATETAKVDSPPVTKSMFQDTPVAESLSRKRPVSDAEFSAMFRKSSAKADLIVRSGLELLGELFTASVYDAKTTLLVELLQMQTKEEMKKETPMPTFSSKDERDQYCSELLNRISLSVDAQGKKSMEIAPAADSLQVLYRRSHYISDRYTVVTVTETNEEILIWVYDPAKSQHLRLPIEKKQGSEMDNTQREILMLVKRIKIEAVLGHETLVLVPA